MQTNTTYCGYISFLGRPNAGKSSLLNSVIGQKIVGVSQKPQTTRNRILGISSEGPYQALYLDTPGLHQRKGSPLNELMNAEAWNTVGEADLICYLVDVSRGWHEDDDALFGRLMRLVAKPVVVLAAKVDKVKKFEAEEQFKRIEDSLGRVLEREGLQEKAGHLVSPQPLPVSAKRPEMVASFREFVKKHLPEGPFLFDPEQLTDRSQKFVVAELIREQIFRLLQKELPYQTSVQVEKFEDKSDILVIYAAIVVGRDSQKRIVIGKKGETIRLVGTRAREQLEKQFEKKVYLELQVRVDHEWFEREDKISEYTDL